MWTKVLFFVAVELLATSSAFSPPEPRLGGIDVLDALANDIGLDDTMDESMIVTSGSGTFVLQSIDNPSLCMHPKGGSADKGKALTWYEGCNDETRLRLREIPRKDGSFYLQSVWNQNCVHPEGGYPNQNTKLVFWDTCDEGDRMAFTKVDQGHGSFILKSKSSGRCVHPSGGTARSDTEWVFHDGCEGSRLALQKVHVKDGFANKTTVQGRWVYWFTKTDAVDMTYTYEVGVTTSEGGERTKEWSSNTALAVSQEYEFLGQGGELSVEKEWAQGGSSAISRSTEKSMVSTHEIEFKKPGAVWQFAFSVQDSLGKANIQTFDLATTKHRGQQPCCLPGDSLDPNKPYGPCRPGASHLCNCPASVCNPGA